MFLERGPEPERFAATANAGRPASGVPLTVCAIVLAAALWWSVAARREVTPEPATGVVIVRTGGQATVPAPVSGPHPTPLPAASHAPVSAATAAAVAMALGESGAALRNVTAVGSDGQVVCGQVTSRERPEFRRFVWLAPVRMLATDDGSADFAEVARACKG
jgi:hypothetical protein